MVKDKIHYYDGWIYRCFVDPFLKGVKNQVVDLVGANSRVIDIACGTGTLAFALSKKCEFVTGIELSSKMVSHAQYAQRKKVIENVKFIHANATTLDFPDKTFDYATISMAFHEMDPDVCVKVLFEMSRVAHQVIVADFKTPLPRGIFCVGVWFAEFMAGMRHFGGFKRFQKNGGMSGLIELSGIPLSISKRSLGLGSAVEILLLN